MPPRIVSPALADLSSLRQPLTQGELKVLNYFLKNLPARWEIYIQPHLNGLRPDFVLLHPKNGIAVFEVKDWDLDAMEYFVQNQGTSHPVLMARKDSRAFSLQKQNPVPKVEIYKNEIFNLYCPRLSAKHGLKSIVAGIIFPFMETDQVKTLLKPFRDRLRHTEFQRNHPVIGSELLEDDREGTIKKHVLHSLYQIDENMTGEVANDLRHWLVEPEFSIEQRRPLVLDLTSRQKDICFNADNVSFRRVRGPAGSGKSLVLAGRAAQLALSGRRVLIITFNITLINYLLDLSVRFALDGKVRKQIEALNFHHWCKRVAQRTGHFDDYHQIWGQHSKDHELVLKEELALAVDEWVEELDESERWDAILLDEGQDFELSWWKALRKGLTCDGKGEALLCADRVQNIYGVKPWTEEEMPGAGFRGKWLTLDKTFRMTPSLCRLAKLYIDYYLPEIDDQRPEPPEPPEPPEGEFEFKTILKWWQVTRRNAAVACVDALIDILATSAPPISYSDLVCIVDNAVTGLSVVELLHAKGIAAIHTFGSGDSEKDKNTDSRRKKMAFFKGDARVKITTLHSFKGWETKALVVQISRADTTDALALAYAGITRLKRDDTGCYLTVVNSTRELSDYGRRWPVYEQLP